jgi:hypothetical protein
MNEKKSGFERAIFAVFAHVVVILFGLGMLFYTPFDYFKYKRTRFYKDTKQKYSWLCMSSYYIKLYDLIKNENLPIDYYPCDYSFVMGYGYFVYKDTLILNDYSPCYDAKKNIWLVEIEDEYVDIKIDVEAAIANCNERFGPDLCKRAVVLIDKDLFEEHPNVYYENIEFLPAKNDCDIDALRTLIDRG